MQTSAEADAKQADMRSKHLQKQLAEQHKGLQSLEKEAVRLQRDLAKEEAAVQSCRSRCLLHWTLGSSSMCFCKMSLLQPICLKCISCRDCWFMLWVSPLELHSGIKSCVIGAILHSE
jgi:hypothetical protein